MNQAEVTLHSPPVHEDQRLVRIVEEYRALLEAGQKPERRHFLERYPDLAASLNDCFDGLEFVFTVAPDMRDASAPRGSPDPVGTLPTAVPLGDYRVVREIGRGGMGVVYEAEQMLLGRRVALKVLPFAATMDSRQLQRFQNEARAAACLHHPHIVPVYAVGCERGVHFYAMQFIDGQSLAEVLADLRKETPEPDAPARKTLASASGSNAPTPPVAALSTQLSTRGPAFFHAAARLGVQAAQALDHAHQLGVLHRDIKPANLMVDGRGNAWITDFGLAHIQGGDVQLTMTGDLVGTLRYMSPEQALAKRVLVDHRTDIYSLGATLYELLTLAPVFPGGDRQELLRQIAFEEPLALRRHNKAIPAELETIVLKALEKNPVDRYASAQELAEDLERFGKDEPIKARRPSLVRRVKGWCRRHKAVVTSLVAIVSTALLLGGAVLWSRERQRVTTAQAVADDLQSAALWQGQERWTEALQALERARGRLEGSGQASLITRVEEQRRDVALVVRLAEAQQKSSSVSSDGKRDFAEADRLFAKTFEENGLNVKGLPSEEIARQIKASPVRNHLVIALYNWANVKERIPGGKNKTLLAIAQLVDDDLTRQGNPKPEEVRDRIILKRLLDVMEIQPEEPHDYQILAHLMWLNHRFPEAVALSRKAIELYPEPVQAVPAYIRLGDALASQNNCPQAVAVIRTAIELNPKDPASYAALAHALRRQGKLTQAATAFRMDFKLRPRSGHWNGLGRVLFCQQKLSEAVDACRMAIRINSKDDNAHIILSMALREQGRPEEAALVRQKATDLKHYFAAENSFLGYYLQQQGKFAEGLIFIQKAHDFNPGNIFYGSAEDVRWSKQLVMLEIMLPKILKGEILPSDAAEILTWAEFCQLRGCQYYAASARFYSEAFAADPKLVGELRADIRYDAACAAAQAGCGLGKDAGNLDAKEYARLRAQALAWLWADLTGWRSEITKEPKYAIIGALYEMDQWQQEPALSGVRADEALAKLPEAERREWQEFWAEVAELEKRAK